MLSLQTSHSLPRELFLTLNKILGTERTWMREGRRNNAGFLVPFTVTKKISFETTIFKVKKHFYCTNMGFLIFFFFQSRTSLMNAFVIWETRQVSRRFKTGGYTVLFLHLQGDLWELKGPLLCLSTGSELWSTRGFSMAASPRPTLFSSKVQLRYKIKPSSDFPDTQSPAMSQLNYICPSLIPLAGKSVPKSAANSTTGPWHQLGILATIAILHLQL